MRTKITTRNGKDIYGNEINKERAEDSQLRATMIMRLFEQLMGEWEGERISAGQIAEALYYCPIEDMRTSLIEHALTVEKWRLELVEQVIELRGMIEKFLEVDDEIRRAVNEAGAQIVPFPGPPQNYSTKDWIKWIKRIFSTKEKDHEEVSEEVDRD